ncbi:hypothetical protein C6503_16525 [Candidatus Poribacteria bacterium]|nr:MAG: hypothetical protein C6503_16525 [Candidatus Poribacteria bacterium]
MKTILTVLTIIGLLTFCLIGSLSADRLLYERAVHRENESVNVTKGHPWWQGDGDATTRDGDITVSAEKRIFDVSEPSSPIPEPASVKETPNSPPRLGKQPHILSRAPFQSSSLLPAQSDFYRTIIDNNLFRPLGWTPPHPKEPYRLLGTMVPKDGKTPPQAIILATAGNKTHIVTIGDKLEIDTTITNIQSKRITLDSKGQRRILKLDTSAWINASKHQFRHRR